MHTCPVCDQACYCSGDIDDSEVMSLSWAYHNCTCCDDDLFPKDFDDGFDEEIEDRKCKYCGCTDEDCRQCIERTGQACHWISDDVCSACADKAELNNN